MSEYGMNWLSVQLEEWKLDIIYSITYGFVHIFDFFLLKSLFK